MGKYCEQNICFKEITFEIETKDLNKGIGDLYQCLYCYKFLCIKHKKKHENTFICDICGKKYCQNENFTLTMYTKEEIYKMKINEYCINCWKQKSSKL